MKLGMQIGYSGASVADTVTAAKLADELNFHSIWTAEAYGSDAITPLVWMGAHTQNVKLATGIGKPLKSILHPRPDIPVVIAAIGPKNVALSGEIADGFIPAFFNPYRSDVFTGPLGDGFKRRAPDLRPASEFDVFASCAVIVT